VKLPAHRAGLAWHLPVKREIFMISVFMLRILPSSRFSFESGKEKKDPVPKTLLG